MTESRMTESRMTTKQRYRQGKINPQTEEEIESENAEKSKDTQSQASNVTKEQKSKVVVEKDNKQHQIDSQRQASNVTKEQGKESEGNVTHPSFPIGRVNSQLNQMKRSELKLKAGQSQTFNVTIEKNQERKYQNDSNFPTEKISSSQDDKVRHGQTSNATEEKQINVKTQENKSERNVIQPNFSIGKENAQLNQTKHSELQHKVSSQASNVTKEQETKQKNKSNENISNFDKKRGVKISNATEKQKKTIENKSKEKNLGSTLCVGIHMTLMVTYSTLTVIILLRNIKE